MIVMDCEMPIINGFFFPFYSIFIFFLSQIINKGYKAT